jgi:hypothetical protein
MEKAIVKGVKMVGTDQVNYYESFWEHPKSMVLPSFLGVALVVAAIVVISTTGECKGGKPNDPDDEVCTGQNVGLFAALLVAGLLLLTVVGVYRAILNPRAVAEQMLADQLF